MAALARQVETPKMRPMADSDLEESFMKKIASFILAAGALIVTASCAKEINVVDPTPENGKEINITVIASEKPEVEAETKTFIDGTSVKWSASGEKLKVFEVATPAEGDVATTQATSADGVTSDGGATMSFGVPLADKSEGYTSFDYYAVYPSSAYQTGSTVSAIALNTKGSQTPTATNFDASQDLLIAKKIENGATQASTLEMQFARVVAIGKMTIKNLESTDPITKITFSAKVGEEAVALAGRTNFNLETAKPVSAYASNTQDHAIILDYEGQNITANTSAGMVAYFTCYPFAINSETPGSFKVVVETATQSFTKEVSVSSAKGLAFNIGKASVFSVNMDGITGETKEVDLRYAYLDSEDYANAGGGNSYSNITVNKTHGDSWETYAMSQAGIQINSGYYIKLPDFAEDIKTVIVTLPVAASGKTLSLNTLANGSGTEIASLTTDSELSYEFDLSSDSYKTAYLISNGAIKFSKIEVYAGTDNRAVLDAPQNVAASLNNDDAEVTNSIDVTWDAVSGAGSYIITLKDENTDITTKVADASPFTVTGLAYDMEYLIAVKAVPADPYINKESAETDAASAVTTGSEPVAAAFELVTSLANVTTGQYVIAAHVGDKYYAMSNSFASKISGTEIAVVNNKISTSAAVGYEVTITRVDNTVSIYNGSEYLAIATTGTNFTIQDGAFYNTIASGSNGGTFHISNTRGLIYRASTYNQFGNYASVNGTEYYDVELFKLADPRTDVTLTFAEDAFELTVDSSEYDSFTPQAATATPSVSPITYAIEDNDGVTSNFNTSTGAFTLTGALGTATITASYAGDSNYKPAEASYTVTVKASSINTSTQANPYSVSDVISLIGTLDSSTEVEDVYVKGIVSEIVEAYNSKYGNVTFNISADGTTDGDQFEAYRAVASSADDFQVGDAVLMVGTAKNYNGNTPEYIAGATAVTVIHKPTFTPNGGSFTEDAKSVTISAAAGTTIYYTIDGTDPTTSSSVYSSALSLTSTTTVKAIAVKDGLTTGIASATFTKSVGGSVHVATINFNSGTGTAINAASVTGDDSEGNEWTITTAGTDSYTANAAYYQVGSSKKPASSITFTTTLASSATDIELEAKFGGFSGTTGDVTLKVGDSSIGTGSLNAANDVTVSSTSTGSGTVLTVTITHIAKGVKVYYIKATYTTE